MFLVLMHLRFCLLFWWFVNIGCFGHVMVASLSVGSTWLWLCVIHPINVSCKVHSTVMTVRILVFCAQKLFVICLWMLVWYHWSNYLSKKSTFLTTIYSNQNEYSFVEHFWVRITAVFHEKTNFIRCQKHVTLSSCQQKLKIMAVRVKEAILCIIFI